MWTRVDPSEYNNTITTHVDNGVRHVAQTVGRLKSRSDWWRYWRWPTLHWSHEHKNEKKKNKNYMEDRCVSTWHFHLNAAVHNMCNARVLIPRVDRYWYILELYYTHSYKSQYNTMACAQYQMLKCEWCTCSDRQTGRNTVYTGTIYESIHRSRPADTILIVYGDRNCQSLRSFNIMLVVSVKLCQWATIWHCHRGIVPVTASQCRVSQYHIQCQVSLKTLWGSGERI